MIQNLKENWPVAWKMTYIIWLIFMQAVKGLKIWNLIGFFVQSIWNFWWKSTEKLCLMTLKSDAKFEEKLILGSKNDMRNLVSFNASSGKSENLHFDVLLLSIAYKVSAKNVQKNYLSWHWKKDPNFKEKLTFCLKNDMRNLVNFNPISGMSENLKSDCVVKNDLWFQKWHK